MNFVLKVIDLFAGVGGMSLGAAKAGFNVLGSIELDPIPGLTHKFNFPNSKHLQQDISTLSGKDICEAFSIKKGELEGVIGGPPCQGFSTIGKQDIEDPRNVLFIHFFRVVKELQPRFFVAENVPGILNPKYDGIRSQALEMVSDKYVILPPITINAKDYGAPTIRTRVFFIGYKKRDFSPIDIQKFNAKNDIKINLVRDAFIGLPQEINIYENKSNEVAWEKIEKISSTSYPEVISNLINGVGNSDSIERYINQSEVTGIIGTRHTRSVLDRFEKLLPGETDKVSRSYRLKLDGFSPTLRAGTNSDNGSFQAVRPIHPIENRVITPREAARIQGFPDWFQFHKTKWHSFRQIGNSVSPIVSEFIMRKIKEHLKLSDI